LLATTRGRRGLLAGVAIAGPMLLKRVVGNGPLDVEGGRVVAYVARLLFDRDQWVATERE
jgi:hypothetical protein